MLQFSFSIKEGALPGKGHIIFPEEVLEMLSRKGEEQIADDNYDQILIMNRLKTDHDLTVQPPIL